MGRASRQEESKLDNLESAICDVHEEIAQIRSQRSEIDKALKALEMRWRMLEGKPSETHRHRAAPIAAHTRSARRHTGKDCPA